jgi:predicted RNA binding protein YcfA (HicA-like mRNA interferase family)
MYKPLSGRQVIKILCKNFGFYFISQKGSHVKLKKQVDKQEIITIVPLHKELAPGTIKGILKLAQIEEKDFWRKVWG